MRAGRPAPAAYLNHSSVTKSVILPQLPPNPGVAEALLPYRDVRVRPLYRFMSYQQALTVRNCGTRARHALGRRSTTDQPHARNETYRIKSCSFVGLPCGRNNPLG